MKKLTFCLRRRPDLSWEAFETYWREHHAPLVLARADVLGIRRYTQVRTERNPKLHQRLQGRNGGSPEEFDGIAELWYDADWPLGVRTEAARLAAAELLADEKNFIDLKRSPMTMGSAIELIFAPAIDGRTVMKLERSLLVGQWVLSSWEVVADDGRPPRHPFGTDAVGRLTYTPSGQMSVTITASSRKRLEVDSIKQASEAQKAAAFESIFHYLGHYEVQDNAVVHNVLMSSNPNLEGTQQVRAARVHENCLVLETVVDPDLGGQTRHRLTWRRC